MDVGKRNKEGSKFMQVVYEKFRTPTKIKREPLDKSGLKTRFIAEPFEKGYGLTVGNSLRRVLLTSIESYAVISVFIQDVAHEYTAIPGIIEDMTSIVINLKGVLLRKLTLEGKPAPRGIKKVVKDLKVTTELLNDNNGEYVVRVKDLFDETEFDVINPEHKIFTVTQPLEKRIEFKVAVGRGYCPSERLVISDKAFSEIIIDAAFSPVRLVNYFVEECRVGGETDLDRLILEITTDGRITPEEAMTHAVQILSLHLNVFDEMKMQTITFDTEESEDSSDRDAVMSKLGLKISEIELSVRSTNCLYGANIATIAELVSKSEQEMLKYRNFGKKSLNEIKAKLEEMGLQLGMDISKYGIEKGEHDDFFDTEDDEGFEQEDYVAVDEVEEEDSQDES